MSNRKLSPTAISDQPKRTGDTVQFLMEDLRYKILGGELAPGTRIREVFMAKAHGVSRAPLREALRLLEEAGLISKMPNRSYIVAVFTDRDIFELATLRTALEVLGARLSLQRSHTAPALVAALQILNAAAKARDVKAISAADRHFHEILIECADHKRLLASYRRLRDQIELAMLNVQRRSPDLLQIAERHQRLVDLAGEPDRFVSELTRHIREGMGITDVSVLG